VTLTGSGLDIGTIAETCNAPAAIPKAEYFAGAVPVTPNGTGTRYFGTDTRGTIFQDTVAPITAPITPSTTVKPVQ